MRSKKKTILALLASSLILVTAFGITVRTQCNVTGITPIPSTSQYNLQDTIKDYQHAEESTFLTLPEWHIVFSAQAQGKYYGTNRQSSFPYFSSIYQFWCGYSNVHSYTKQFYPFNSGNHLMLVVVGTSYTTEYLLKGIYENTLGKLNELLSFNQRVEEDDFEAQVAQEYGAFMTHTAWYEFPFIQKTQQLWTRTSLIGPWPLRKLERKVILTAEYLTKASYAIIIRKATETVYDPAALTIYAIVDDVPSEVSEQYEKVKIVQELPDGKKLITLPRYKEFSEQLPELAKYNFHYFEIGGNNEIMVTVLAPENKEIAVENVSELFRQKYLIESNTERIVLRVPVTELNTTLNYARDNALIVEHLYDF